MPYCSRVYIKSLKLVGFRPWMYLINKKANNLSGKGLAIICEAL